MANRKQERRHNIRRGANRQPLHSSSLGRHHAAASPAKGLETPPETGDQAETGIAKPPWRLQQGAVFKRREWRYDTPVDNTRAINTTAPHAPPSLLNRQVREPRRHPRHRGASTRGETRRGKRLQAANSTTTQESTSRKEKPPRRPALRKPTPTKTRRRLHPRLLVARGADLA